VSDHAALITGIHSFNKSVKVQRTANQTIPNTTWTTIVWQVERWDTDNIWEGVTNPERLTCRTAGKAMIILLATWVLDATGYRTYVVQKNGANIWVGTYNAVDGKETVMVGNFPDDMAVDDYYTFLVYQNSGGDLDMRYEESCFIMIRVP
ncbi:unnamed protein product, partial [marine sediment metagenome]